MELEIKNIPNDRFYDVQEKILRLLISEGFEDIKTIPFQYDRNQLSGYEFVIKE